MQPATRQFKKVSSAGSYRKWNFWKEGDYLIGKYLREESKPYGREMKKQWVIEVEETNFNLNGFVDPKGKSQDCGNLKAGTLIALNDNTSLAKAMELAHVEPGFIIKVTFAGTYIIKSGPYAGKEGKDVTLEIAEIGEAQDEVKANLDY